MNSMRHTSMTALIITACALAACGRSDQDRFNQMIYDRNGHPRVNPAHEIIWEWFPEDAPTSDVDVRGKLHELAWIVEHGQGYPRVVAMRVLLMLCETHRAESRLVDQRVVDALVKNCLELNRARGVVHVSTEQILRGDRGPWQSPIAPSFGVMIDGRGQWEWRAPDNYTNDFGQTNVWRFGRVRLRLDSLPEFTSENPDVEGGHIGERYVFMYLPHYLDTVTSMEGEHIWHYDVEIIGPNGFKTPVSGQVTFVVTRSESEESSSDTSSE